MKKMMIAVLATLFVVGLSTAAMAFHGGGVAHCNGCHTMHNSQDGTTLTVTGAAGIGTGQNSNLTIGSDPSSTCLSCHLDIYKAASTDGTAFTPGGDFYWVQQDGIPTDDRGGSATGDSHGHNVIANDFGYLQDAALVTGPSNGTVNYPANRLGCESCHDPHGMKDNDFNPFPIAGSGSYGAANPNDNTGNVLVATTVLGNYRLLGGLGYDGGGAPGIAFTAGDPVARAYAGSRGQWPAETDINHVDYGSGMSEWCANCHSGFTATGSAAHRHPAADDAHLDGFSTVYSSYITTGNLNGVAATAYDRLVPFERGVTDSTTLDPTRTDGPNSTSNVMCLTCHRAHATAWPDALKWDPDTELLAHSEALVSAGTSTVVDFAGKAYYGDDIAVRYSEYQRSLCNKCHLQD